jgi:hypothetical protein
MSSVVCNLAPQQRRQFGSGSLAGCGARRTLGFASIAISRDTGTGTGGSPVSGDDSHGIYAADTLLDQRTALQLHAEIAELT